MTSIIPPVLAAAHAVVIVLLIVDLEQRRMIPWLTGLLIATNIACLIAGIAGYFDI